MKGSRPLADREIPLVLEQLGRNKYATRDRALFQLGVRSGFRISELLSLRLGDVLQNGHFVDRITVQRRNMKKKMEGRTIVLHPEARAALELWARELESKRRDPDTFLFQSREGVNRPMNRRTAWAILKKAYAGAGMTGKLGTHCMRKTFAKKVHEKLGRDLMKTQRALGHRSVNSTVSYLSFSEEEIDDAILKS